jgi:DNA repair exonuclease SbcCD ATPase subunit
MDDSLTQRVGSYTHFVGRLDHQLDAEATGITRLKAKISQLEADKIQLVKAVGLIDRAIQIISANGIGKIESIVTAGLQLVFKDPQMGLLVEKKEGARGNTYRLLVRQGEITGEPMSTRGGGVVNIVAFLLRVILIKRFKLAQFIVLDESFNNVSPDYQPRVSELLHEMCQKFKFTIFAITHQPRLIRQADAVYRVSAVKGQPPVLRRLEGQELEDLKATHEVEIA